MKSRLTNDLEHILEHTHGLWEEVRGNSIFITGGTGFFGCWLLESFLWINSRLNLNAKIVVLTRNIESFRKKAPHLVSSPDIEFVVGDVRKFDFPRGIFSHIVHAAAESKAKYDDENPLEMLDTIIQGTRHTLDFAVSCGAKKYLLTSSGAVYGKQPLEIRYIPETYMGAPDVTDQTSMYGEGKRMAELLCTAYANKYGFETKIARCFAFVGPYLPLDKHFAIGNFIQDSLHGGPIKVKGDGTSYRSYLYAADLTVWLWTILFKGESSYPYNVGSSKEVTIEQVANIVARSVIPASKVDIAEKPNSGNEPERYTPDVNRVKNELCLSETINLPEAIRLTRGWHINREV
ncbi:dTDP-glucose 4,6-dehydratase [subsurface metagenome]